LSAITGKGAILYLATSTSGNAVNIAEQIDYSIETDQAVEEVSALGSTWAVHVLTGSRKWSATGRGNFDVTSNNLWTACNAQQPLRFYLYPQSSAATLYYYGTGWVKLGTVIAGGNASAPKTSWSIQGEGELAKN
jgi:hypothetical protein